jgi:pyruvate dehydrogenase E2 component (dihydrolipoamide acetyltransferase)
MAIAIKIPDIGTTTSTVKLIRWLKKEGDFIKRGDFICEVETDKATNTLESIAEGTILKILVEEETEIDQGTVIAYVGTPGDKIPDKKDEPQFSSKENSADEESKSSDESVKVPLILQNLSDKYGVDLKAVSGTGSMGKITREDILKAKERKIGETKSLHNLKPLSANQAIVSSRVMKSINSIPPIHLTGNIDMTGVISGRNNLNTGSGEKILFDAFFVKALASSMMDFPHFRSRIENGKVVEFNAANIGIAVSHEYDLYIPVIRNSNKKTVLEIDSELRRLIRKVSDGQLSQEDLTGATVSVSNLGMYPVHSFQAIIPPDQVSVLSIGTITDTIISKNSQPVVLPMVTVTLTVDHRLINGREAGEFMAIFKKLIEVK